MIGLGPRVPVVLGSVSPLSLILSAEPEAKAPLLCLLRQVFQDLLQLGTSDPKSLKELTSLLHAAPSPADFSLFLSNATSVPSSHGMVNSAMMTVLVMVDQSMMSGRWEVIAICCGNFCWQSRSALRAHSPPHDSRDLSLMVPLNASPPCLTNWRGWCDAVGLALFTSLHASVDSASFRRTRLWHHPYGLWVSAVSQRGCAVDWDSGGHRVGSPLLCHTSGSSSSFWGLGRVLYVDLIEKRNLAWGNFYKSAHMMVLSMMASQVVHLTRWDWLTALIL